MSALAETLKARVQGFRFGLGRSGMTRLPLTQEIVEQIAPGQLLAPIARRTGRQSFWKDSVLVANRVVQRSPEAELLGRPGQGAAVKLRAAFSGKASFSRVPEIS